VTRTTLPSDLIDRIFEAGLDPDRWTALLANVAAGLGCGSAGVYVVDPRTGRGRVLAAYGWPEDPERRATLERRLAVVARDREIHFDAVAPAGRGALVLPLACGEEAALGAWCLAEILDEVDTCVELLKAARQISPHILRGLRTAGQVERQRATASILQHALDVLTDATLIVDGRGEVVFRNAEAATQLRTGLHFRERDGRLMGTTPAAATIVARLTSPRRAGGEPDAGDAELENPGGGLLRVSWSRMGDGSGAHLVVMQTGDFPLGHAARRFELTMAEVDVLGQLLDGATLQEAAENLGVARSTVKTHLDAIFRKSETRRRAELVRRTMALRPRLRS
jgi:DNA-binding CsgD family transcriptional regulator